MSVESAKNSSFDKISQVIPFPVLNTYNHTSLLWLKVYILIINAQVSTYAMQ